MDVTYQVFGVSEQYQVFLIVWVVTDTHGY
jgi:hypothetical protein